MSTLAPEVETELPLLEQGEPLTPPFINLLPPEIAERRALKKLAGGLAAVLLAAVAATGGLVYQAGSGKGDAQAQLSAEQAETARLQTQLNSLSAARTAQEQLQAAQTALRAAMANEVLWSAYLDQMRLRLPEGVRLTNLVIAPSGAAATGSASTGTAASGAPAPSGGATSGTTATAGTDPSAIATVTLSGKAVSQEAVANWLDALPGIKGYTNPFLTSTTQDRTTGLINFIVTVDATADALSHRYDNQAGS